MKHRSQILLPNSLWHLWLSVLFLVGCVASAATPVAPTIVLHLRNGDRLTGEILKETRTDLVLRSTVAGRITVPLELIERREFPALRKPVTEPEPNPSAPPAVPTAVAKALPPPPSGSAPTPVVANPTNHLAVQGMWSGPWHPHWLTPFTTNWHGNVGLGLNLGFGTTDRQMFFVTANANHAWQRIINTVNYNAAYGLVNEIEAANRMEGMLKTDVFVDRTRRLYAYNIALGGYDEVRRLDQRLEEGLGMGYRIHESPRMIVSLELGGQYQHFKYSSQPDREILSARISENLNWKPSEKLTISQKLQFMPNVSNPSDYRVRMDLIATLPVFKRITLSLNAVNEYEAYAPRGVDNNDLQVTTNVNITF